MEQFLDPLVLARVKDMPLVAKTVAQGFLHGLHNSVKRGTGIEFSQYRAYEPGDALSNIDWKLFARSDRYFVREAERESNINIWLVLDASASMLQQASHSKEGWNKFDYARHLLATIAYIAHQQGDGLGLLGLSSQNLNFLPALPGKQQWQKCLLQLSEVQAGDVFPDSAIIQNHLAKMHHNAVIFVVSDFYEHNNEIFDFMGSLSSHKTEVVALQLESNDEITFPYQGHIRFEDRETKQQVLVSAKDVKADYLENRLALNQSISERLAANNIQHIQGNIDEPLDKTLHQFLSARQKVL
ncbi:DUF58 domain-containing protein [Paraglaciecola marina]|uniref:DUF58 domain-containing protein n=1 Tax=Paraglaciecola marina TaxID=2500157 RepID=UPI00105C4020|nr:DUF58 domain-containing protein [Paraglaciecola marina]